MRLCQATTPKPTGCLVLASGTVLYGTGAGATGTTVGEVCFNTAMTGYQEILTDPSYAEQIITFTFPHIGNVGVNNDDMENATDASMVAARGAIFRADITNPSNFRAQFALSGWLKRRGILALSGIDTRALTNFIREEGMPHAALAHDPAGQFDIAALQEKARAWPGLTGRDLAHSLTATAPYDNDETDWQPAGGFRHANPQGAGQPHIVVIDYGTKRNILRRLAAAGARVSAVPADTPADTILGMAPDGVVLSNGPGDPAATAKSALPVIRKLIDSGMPIFGICLGHQLLALALGASTRKMDQGHHGANHPVKDVATGKVEIVSMNHGFTVDRESLPDSVTETHVSLFDGTNCGIAHKEKPVFSVQHHPEASPGPQDSFDIFVRFVEGLGKAA